MEDNTKRLIVMSILAYAIGTFIFAAGLMTKTAVSIILFYIIASKSKQRWNNDNKIEKE